MDFTPDKYKALIQSLKDCGYSFVTFCQYSAGVAKSTKENGPVSKTVVLRHDVDKLPFNSLQFARLEADLGVKSTYYFRTVPCSWNEKVIEEIAALGHEIGYHYECMDTCHGNVDAAFADFVSNLEKFRDLTPVLTICMHGSPRSQFDNRDLWKKYSYKDLGITAEPYIDVDFSKMFYLTDTGRRWDGYKVSVRDKIPGFQEIWENSGLVFHSTSDILKALKQKSRNYSFSGSNRVCFFPETIMITTHPQRWNVFGARWMKELLLQKLKNFVKFFVVSVRHR